MILSHLDLQTQLNNTFIRQYIKEWTRKHGYKYKTKFACIWYYNIPKNSLIDFEEGTLTVFKELKMFWTEFLIVT